MPLLWILATVRRPTRFMCQAVQGVSTGLRLSTIQYLMVALVLYYRLHCVCFMTSTGVISGETSTPAFLLVYSRGSMLLLITVMGRSRSCQ